MMEYDLLRQSQLHTQDLLEQAERERLAQEYGEQRPHPLMNAVRKVMDRIVGLE
jgi:hypothetical protein